MWTLISCVLLALWPIKYLVAVSVGKLGELMETQWNTLGGGLIASLVEWFRRCFFQGTEIDPLPEDLVLEIVSRLSSEDVLKCRMVCKSWMALTSTPCFIDLHFSRAPSMMLLLNLAESVDTRLYSLDLTQGRVQPYLRRLDTTKLPLADQYYLAGTCDGLVLLWTTGYPDTLVIYVVSLLTGRVVAEVKTSGYNCSGLWFHPSKKEYLFLVGCQRRPGDLVSRKLDYKIFNLSGDWTVIGSYKAYPSFDAPINVSGSLHHLLDSTTEAPPNNCIMILNIESEKIDFKRHPGSGDCRRGGHVPHKEMSLLELDGSLAFCHVYKQMNFLHLWILFDREGWQWIPWYTIQLKDICGPYIDRLQWVNISEGEMLIKYARDRLISVNLETTWVRKIDIRLSSFLQSQYVIPTTYQNSLVGLSRLGLA